jgi:hypothetical protein
LKLGELHGSFPFGVVLVKDESSKGMPPDWKSAGQQIIASDSAMVIRIQHEVDGPASVIVWDEKAPNPSDLNLGTVALTSSSGVLYISTAGGDRSTRVPVPRGPLEIEVVGSAPQYPDRIDLIVRRAGAST